MTKNIGFDQFWDDGGALPPDQAAKILSDWVEKDFDLKLTGTYWAPRGTRYVRILFPAGSANVHLQRYW